MTERILGPTGSKRRRRFLWVPMLLVACTALFVIAGAQAVHDLDFQLDGETTNVAYSPPGTSTPGKDWNSLFDVTNDTAAGTQKVANSSVIDTVNGPFAAASFVRDFESGSSCTLNSTSTTFCTADNTTYATGSKDTLDIGGGGWQCNNDHNVNSKIDIMNAYTASYFTGTNKTGDHIIYFGLEKNKDNGTNDVGFWFLQGDASCSAPSGHVDWTGGHQDGDTLVVSEFSGGGGVSTIKAFRWALPTGTTLPGCLDSNDNNDTHVVVNGTSGCNNLPFATGADCKKTNGPDNLCATTNAKCTTAGLPCSVPWNDNVTTNWLTADATLGVGTTVVPPDFFEGGINITKAFAGKGGTTPSCFTVIVPDTRSSASPTATLFDFVLNRIGECKSSLTTTPSTTLANNPVAPGTAVTDIAKFAGTTSGGSAPNPSSPPNVFFSICGPIPTTSTVLACDGSDAAHTAASVSNQPWVHCTGVATPSSFCTGADPQGTSEAQSSSVSKTAAGIYCFKATWAGDTNYPTGASDIGDTTTGTECYRVKDTSTTTTEQNWLPNDTAHVRNSSGGAASGSVVFTLYNNGTCNPGANNADVLATFPSTGSITLDASGDASTNNTTTYVAHQPGATVSWKVVYTPANSNDISGSTSSCESSVLTINNNPNSP